MLLGMNFCFLTTECRTMTRTYKNVVSCSPLCNTPLCYITQGRTHRAQNAKCELDIWVLQTVPPTFNMHLLVFFFIRFRSLLKLLVNGLNK